MAGLQKEKVSADQLTFKDGFCSLVTCSPSVQQLKCLFVTLITATNSSLENIL